MTITDLMRFSQIAAQEVPLGKSGLNPKVYLPSIIKIKLKWKYFKNKTKNNQWLNGAIPSLIHVFFCHIK